MAHDTNFRAFLRTLYKATDVYKLSPLDKHRGKRDLIMILRGQKRMEWLFSRKINNCALPFVDITSI